MAVKRIDFSVAYAIWAGLGTPLIAVIGVVYFRDDLNMVKTISLVAIVAGVVGLNLAGAGGET